MHRKAKGKVSSVQVKDLVMQDICRITAPKGTKLQIILKGRG